MTTPNTGPQNNHEIYKQHLSGTDHMSHAYPTYPDATAGKSLTNPKNAEEAQQKMNDSDYYRESNLKRFGLTPKK